jgi:hypothetical protein
METKPAASSSSSSSSTATYLPWRVMIYKVGKSEVYLDESRGLAELRALLLNDLLKDVEVDPSDDSDHTRALYDLIFGYFRGTDSDEDEENARHPSRATHGGKKKRVVDFARTEQDVLTLIDFVQHVIRAAHLGDKYEVQACKLIADA